MLAKVFGWLLVCDPPNPSVGELCEMLVASRSAVHAAVGTLEGWSWVRRSRASGERFDRVELDPDIWLKVMDSEADYSAIGTLVRVGLDALSDAPSSSQTRLREMAAFCDFLGERMPAIHAEWQVRRDQLRSAPEAKP